MTVSTIISSSRGSRSSLFSRLLIRSSRRSVPRRPAGRERGSPPAACRSRHQARRDPARARGDDVRALPCGPPRRNCGPSSRATAAGGGAGAGGQPRRQGRSRQATGAPGGGARGGASRRLARPAAVGARRQRRRRARARRRPGTFASPSVWGPERFGLCERPRAPLRVPRRRPAPRPPTTARARPGGAGPFSEGARGGPVGRDRGRGLAAPAAPRPPRRSRRGPASASPVAEARPRAQSSARRAAARSPT